MKKWLMLIVLFCAGVAHGYYGWGVYGSYWRPDDADGEFGPGAKITIEMVPAVQLELRGSYFNRFEASGDSDVELRLIPLEAGLALALPVMKTHRAFAGGGVSYFFADATDGPDIDDELGGYLVAGVEFQVQEMAALFAEGKYNFVKFDEDISLNGPGVNAGLLITW